MQTLDELHTPLVTNPEHFNRVAQEVISRVVETAKNNETLRIWFSGCGEGLEVYSLVIALQEAVLASQKKIHIRVFATDTNVKKIHSARIGNYTKSDVAYISNTQLEKYTDSNYNGCVIKPIIKQKITFAKQSLLYDPPYSSMHLVCCAYQLDALTPTLKSVAIDRLFYALNPQAFLLLSQGQNLSENNVYFKRLKQVDTCYTSVKSMHRSYISKSDKKRLDNNKVFDRSILFTPLPKRFNHIGSEIKATCDLLLADYDAPAVVINNNNQSVHTKKELGDYLPIENSNHFDILLNAPVLLRPQLKKAIQLTREKNRPVLVHYAKNSMSKDLKRPFKSVIVPLEHATLPKGYLAIIFGQIDDNIELKGRSSLTLDFENDKDLFVLATQEILVENDKHFQQAIQALESNEHQLKHSQQQRLSTVEELEISNAELKSNASEMRALNHELSLLNKKLVDKIDELSSTNSDINNFFSSTNLATIFLSETFRLKRFTPAAKKLLDINNEDVNEPVTQRDCEFINQSAIKDATVVLKEKTPIERELCVSNGQWYARKILPYFTSQNKVAGVVITFTDITDLKETLQRQEISKRQHEVVAQLGVDALNTEDVRQLMKNALDRITSTLNVDYGCLLSLQSNDELFALSSGKLWNESNTTKNNVPQLAITYASHTLAQKKPVAVDDFSKEDRFYINGSSATLKVGSAISCIFGDVDNPNGVVSVFSEMQHAFTQEDTNFLLSIANILTVANRSKKMRDEVSESEHRLRIAKDSGRMGSFEFDMQKRTLKTDRMLADTWGFDKNIVRHESDFFEGVHESEREYVRIQIQAACDPKTDGRYRAKYRVIHRISKEIRWVDATGQVFFEDNIPIKMIGMLVDITEYKNLEQSLSEAVETLQEANTRKNEFLATLGHELRNPIAAIGGGVQMIRQDASSDDWVLDMMDGNVRLVASLLDDLLDLNRITKGKLTLKPSRVKVNDLLNEINTSFIAKASEKNQTFTFIQPDTPIETYGDAIRLQQMVNNLIYNAAKFTPAGQEISLELRMLANSFQIIVTDNGIGIDPSLHQHIFEPFFQAPNQDAPQGSGLGIGLALVKEFVTLHEGTVELHSDGKNNGSRFTLTIPIVTVPQAPKHKVLAKTASLENLKILVVDDNIGAAKCLEMFFTHKGCEIAMCHTAGDAIKTVETFTPDVFILDIGLPDMSGIELLKRLREKISSPTLNIALTGFGHEQAKQDTQQAGFDVHLTKPVSTQRLIEVLTQNKPTGETS